tara:strand:+ start:412 stop:1716 length:1305 start_codon:yes stop_codon:yes gene_type:complete
LDKLIRIITYNLFLSVASLVGFSSLFLLFVRFSNSPRLDSFLEKKEDSMHCLNSDHAIVSKEQSKLLGEDIQEFLDYCESKKSIHPNRGRAYWDYHYYSEGEVKTQKINFENSYKYYSRRVPCSNDAEENSLSIWMFGGSTMVNLETSDENTISNSLCKNLNFKPNILNLGVGGFHSELETIKFINLTKMNLISSKNKKPDIAIFYNGYNDSYRLVMNSRWSGLPGILSSKFIFNHRMYGVNPILKFIYHIFKSTNYLSLQLADGKSNFISNGLDKIANLIVRSQLFPNNNLLAKKYPSDQEYRGKLLNTRGYIYDQKILKGICEELQIKCFVFFQPLLSQRVKPVGEIEIEQFNLQDLNGVNKIVNKFYDEVKSELNDESLNSSFYNFIDMSQFVNQSKFSEIPFFFDFGHTGFYTSKFIGQEMAKILNKKLF